jgi:hypothetical protein
MGETLVIKLAGLEIAHPFIDIAIPAIPPQSELWQGLRRDIALQIPVDCLTLGRLGLPQPLLGQPFGFRKILLLGLAAAELLLHLFQRQGIFGGQLGV